MSREYRSTPEERAKMSEYAKRKVIMKKSVYKDLEYISKLESKTITELCNDTMAHYVMTYKESKNKFDILREAKKSIIDSITENENR